MFSQRDCCYSTDWGSRVTICLTASGGSHPATYSGISCAAGVLQNVCYLKNLILTLLIVSRFGSRASLISLLLVLAEASIIILGRKLCGAIITRFLVLIIWIQFALCLSLSCRQHSRLKIILGKVESLLSSAGDRMVRYVQLWARCGLCSVAVRFGALKSFNFLIQVGGRSNLGLLAALVFYSAVVLGRGLRSQVHTISLIDYNFWGIYLPTMNLWIL